MAAKKFSVDKGQAAYLLGVDERTITNWQNRTIDPLPFFKGERRGNANQYDPRLLLEWKIRQELAKITGIDSGEMLDLEQERARLAKEQRIAQELKNAQIRREIAPIEAIAFALSRVGTQISAILDTIPGKVRRRVPKLSSAEVEIIKREIIKAQNVAAKVTLNMDDYVHNASTSI